MIFVMQERENNMKIPVIAHNLFGFDLYYFIKGYIASAWYSKELKIGGNNLTLIPKNTTKNV